MNKLLKNISPFAIGLILGILSFLPFTRQTTIASYLTGFGSNTVNQWNYFLDYGSESQNMWQRAYVSLLGLLPSASPEVIYLSASVDDNGDGLVGNCEYTLNGIVPNARYWSYAIYGNDNYYLQDPNNLKENPSYDDLFAQVTNGYEITTNIGQQYEIKIGRNLVSQEGSLSHFGNDFNLILRIYGPDLIYYDNPSLIPVANIVKESCS